jgi:hypothetical protein
MNVWYFWWWCWKRNFLETKIIFFEITETYLWFHLRFHGNYWNEQNQKYKWSCYLLSSIYRFKERSFKFEKTHANADKNIYQVEKYKHYKKNLEILADIWVINLILVNKWKPIVFTIANIYSVFILVIELVGNQTSFICPTVWILMLIFYNKPKSKRTNQKTGKSNCNS